MNKAWEILWMSLIVVAASMIVCFSIHNHTPVGYYLEQQTNGNGAPFCATQSIPWAADVNAFCSNDVDKVLEVIQKANESLKK